MCKLLHMSESRRTYPGGAEALIERWNSRREPFVFYKETLPPLDVDLNELTAEIITKEETKKKPGEPLKGSTYASKRRRVAHEFIGHSRLAYLNALLIANLRRENPPTDCATLFLRLWREQPDHLIQQLNPRWLVSSVMTFADHGKTGNEREIGQAMRMLFGMMKLYEFERLYSGREPRRIWRLARKIEAELPMDMEPFSLKNGGLDAALLAPIWKMSLDDPGIGPLACHLLEMLNVDDKNVFRRFSIMRKRHIAQKAKND